jgi:hypothetical protein
MYARNTSAIIGSDWKLYNKIKDTQLNIKFLYLILLRELIFLFSWIKSKQC